VPNSDAQSRLMNTKSTEQTQIANSSGGSRSWSRLDGVDMLRGLAIFFVIMNHVNMQLLGAQVPYTKGLPQQLVHSFVWNGQFGVQMFFAISGFLITSTTLCRWDSIGNVRVRNFYLLRVARIVPLLLLLLVLLTVLHLAKIPNFTISDKAGGLGHALFAALTFHINLLEARRGYLPPSWDILWSLSVEEVFYLGFPIFCALFRRTRFLVIPLLLLILVGPFARSRAFNHNPVWREYSYLGGMDAIALGCLTALLFAKRQLPRRVLLSLAVGGGALVSFSLGFSIRANSWGLGRNGLNMTILAFGTCTLIVAAAQTRWRAPTILKPFTMLGKRSYEIYLTHAFVVLGLIHLFLRANKPMSAVPLLFFVSILLSALLGAGVAHAFTEPMNRSLRNLGDAGQQSLGSVIPSPQKTALTSVGSATNT
jgi:peptidoglycan/LPS O-acetylase OafA/YrhL